MPPKASKKTVEKQKAKVIDDKTFGLKNKNRSSKVQQYVQSVEKTIKGGSAIERKAAAINEEKKKAKEEKKAFEAEVAKLFNAVPTAKKNKSGDGEGGSDDEGDVDKNLGVNPEDYLWTADDFDAVAEDDARLEETLEEEREALKGRSDLTPVTEESFQAWKKKKREEAQEMEKKRLTKAKSSGQGLRGWDLWQHDQTLFVDDDDADNEYFEQEEEQETDV